MNTYRAAAAAAATCAAALSLAACSAGITSAGSATSAAASSSRPAAASSPASSPASGAVASPSLAVTMISVGGTIGQFPVPAGAAVTENVTISNQIAIGLTKVTPSKAASFYAAELPSDGFKISSNEQISGDTDGTGSVVEIEFSGHGYTGTISALAKVPPSTPDTQFGGTDKNVVTVLLQKK